MRLVHETFFPINAYHWNPLLVGFKQYRVGFNICKSQNNRIIGKHIFNDGFRIIAEVAIIFLSEFQFL